MRTSVKWGLGFLVILIAFVFIGMYGNAPKPPQSGITLSNVPDLSTQPFINHGHAFGQSSAPQFPSQVAQGTQVIRSLLGLEVTFLQGKVNYPGLTIVNDPRYQALTGTEKLLDSIKFQPLNASPFLLLVAIAKNVNGMPLIVPGKFDVLAKTAIDGFILKDSQERIFYYSGYVLATPAWIGLSPGQILQDSFCKVPTQIKSCSAQNTVKVLLKKNPDPRKDIPMLALVR